MNKVRIGSVGLGRLRLAQLKMPRAGYQTPNLLRYATWIKKS